MESAQTLGNEALDTFDRRRHQRVAVNLLGRCMFADESEYPCQLVNISPGGAAFVTPHQGTVGERVVAYVDHVGRLEGTVSRHMEGGFAMAIEASARKRERLADTLTWLANQHVLNLPEDRRHKRQMPRKRNAVLVIDGTEHQCQVMDMSLSGAALATVERPPLKTAVRLGKLGARVVRHFEDGIGIEFIRIMSETAIEQTIEEEFFEPA